MTRLSTHVLDLETGRPRAGVTVGVYVDGTGTELGHGVTDADGRITALAEVEPGTVRVRFAIGGPFLVAVGVTVTIEPGREHLHLPALVSPFGVTLYRGS